MKMSPLLSLSSLLLLGLYTLVFQNVEAVVKGGYWLGGESLAHINFNFQTHVFYAFAGVDPTTYQLVPPEDNGQIATFVASAQKSNPAVVPLLSIGGGSDKLIATFGGMVSTSARRKVFIDSSIKLARQHGFQGLDLDWESPQSQQQMKMLALLLKEWRAATTLESQASGKTQLLLTAAVSYSSILLYDGDETRTWPIAAFNSYLDWANVMNYDYHGSWENFTGEHTALNDPLSDVSTDYGISNWLQAGLQKEKLALGLAYYGLQWILVSRSNTGIGAPAESEGGVAISYRDILVYNAGGATVVQDSTTVCMYSYKPDLTWIGYDSPETIAAKVRYAKSRDLLGFFAWNLIQDTEKWSLASAASNAWAQTQGPSTTR